MDELTGKRVLVAGGTGDVGSGIVEVFLKWGAEVIVPSRVPEKANRLRAALVSPDRLITVPGDVGTVTGAEAVARQVHKTGPLDGVVASLGGWWQGSALIDVDASTWDAVIAGNLTSHYSTAKAFLPLLHDRGGTYVQILGAAAEFPVPRSSLVSITAAAVSMMGRALASESTRLDVRVRQIMIASIVATRARETVDPSWVTAAEVGEIAAGMIGDPAAGGDVVRIAGRSSEVGAKPARSVRSGQAPRRGSQSRLARETEIIKRSNHELH